MPIPPLQTRTVPEAASLSSSPAKVSQSNPPPSKSVLSVTGETSIYFSPSRTQTGKGVPTTPRKLLDAVEILVKSTDEAPLLPQLEASVDVSERLDEKRKLEPSCDASYQNNVPPARDEGFIIPSEAEARILFPSHLISHQVRSTSPTPSSRPRKRCKVASSSQFTPINDKTQILPPGNTTTRLPTIHGHSTDATTLLTSKLDPNVTQPDKPWIPSLRPSENLFTHNYIAAFPSYHQDLFNDLIRYIANAKPILIQEAVSENPWQLMIAVNLLNVTTGRCAIPVFWKLMNRWSTPYDIINDNADLVNILRPLGLYNKRAAWLKAMSQHYLDDPPSDILRVSNCRLEIATKSKITAPTYTNPRKRSSCSRSYRKTTIPYPPTPISHYPGIGRYALDSYRIFCTAGEEWKAVIPKDKELVRYIRWKWAYEERKIWYPGGVGVIKDVDIPYLLVLVDELMEDLEPDEFWGPTDFISG